MTIELEQAARDEARRPGDPTSRDRLLERLAEFVGAKAGASALAAALVLRALARVAGR